MAHLFISYSHTDDEYVNRLAQALEQEGFSAWVDNRIDYGTTWTGEVQRRLDNCDAFLLVMTPRSFESRWVNNELSRAMRKNKPIFPLLLEGDEPWLAVESIQFLDVRGGKLPDERFYSQLATVVERRKPVQMPEPEAPGEALPDTSPQQILIEKPPAEEIQVEQIEGEKTAEEKQLPEAPAEDPGLEIHQVLFPVDEKPRTDLLPEKKAEDRRAASDRIKAEKKERVKPEKIQKVTRQAPTARHKGVRGLAIGSVIAICAIAVGVSLWVFRESLGLTSPRETTSQATLKAGTADSIATWTAGPVSAVPITVENADQVVEMMRWGDGGVISQMALSSLGEVIAVGTTEGVRLLDAVSLEGFSSYTEDFGVTAVTFSQEGKTMAIGRGNTNIEIRDLDGTVRIVLDKTGSSITSLAFDPNDEFLAAGLEDGTVSIWLVEDWSPVTTLVGHGAAVKSIVFVPRLKKLVSGGLDGNVIVWSMTDWTQLSKFEAGSCILSLAIPEASTTVAAGSEDGMIRFWAFSGGLANQLDGHTHRIKCLAYSPDGSVLASGTGNGNIYLWKPVESSEPVVTLEGYHVSQIRSLAFTQDDEALISASVDGSVIRWSLETLTPTATNTEFRQPILYTDLFLDGAALAYTTLDGSLYVDDIFGVIPPVILKGLPDSFGIAFGDDRETLISVSSVGIAKWVSPIEPQVFLVEGFPAEVTSAAFHPDRDVVAVGDVDASIRVYDFGGNVLTEWNMDQAGNAVRLLKYSPDGKHLVASYSDGLLIVFQEVEPQKQYQMQDLGVMKTMTFAPDSGTLLLAGDDGRLRSMSMESGEIHELFIPGLDGAIMMEFSPDGKVLALGMSNYRIMLVDYERLTVVKELEGHTGYVTSITFLPDMSRLISTSMDGTIRFWGVGP